MGQIILVRHTAVAGHWNGRCYGQSDVGLSADGRSEARRIAGELAALAPDRIVASPLRRARFLAALITRELGHASFDIEPRLAECNFGAWEGRSWTDIFAATGQDMMGMVEAPDSFRPGGTGETTYEVRDRALGWFKALPIDQAILAVCHGGPIGALRGSLAGAGVAEWPALVPRYGEWVRFSR